MINLRSCLTQEAAKAIVSLGNTTINYSLAWEILGKRYNQPAKSLSLSLFEELQSSPNQAETHYGVLQAFK
jgi:hypothetical protein